jgi:hypothetical protein
MLIRLPWRANLSFAIIVAGASLFLLAIFVPQLPGLYGGGATLFVAGLLVHFLTWDMRAKALRAQLREEQGLELTLAQAEALLEARTLQLADGRSFRLLFHGTRTLESLGHAGVLADHDLCIGRA